jgi:hypothetical protein
MSITAARLLREWTTPYPPSLPHSTEMAEASLEIGFKRLGCPEVASWTLPINLASQRVHRSSRYHQDLSRCSSQQLRIVP